MKIKSLIFASLFLASFTTYAASSVCDYKANRIQQQISIAKSYGNFNRVRGLERALSKVRRYCKDGHIFQEQNDKIADKKEDILDIKNDIYKKSLANKKSKVRKLERKLAKKQAELDQLEQELKEMEAL